MYPVDVRAEYGDGSRSRGLAAAGVVFFLKALLALPHFIILGALIYAAGLIAYFGYFVIAFTGNLPEFFHTFPLRVMQWQTRATGWLITFDDAYPPFEWENTTYSVRLDVTEGPGARSKGIGVLGIFYLKFIAVIPHAVVLAFVQLAAGIATWAGYIVVLFTGKLPEGIFMFNVGALRWNQRVAAWLFSLTDEYPPFTLSANAPGAAGPSNEPV